MKKELKIDISQGLKNRDTIIGVSGRKLGQTQRTVLKIDSEEDKYEKVLIHVPNNYLYVSSSFFLGLLGKSVRKCGSANAFLSKFSFDCDEDIMESVREGINDALRIGDGLDDK